LNNEEVHNSYSSPNIVTVINSGRMSGQERDKYTQKFDWKA